MFLGGGTFGVFRSRKRGVSSRLNEGFGAGKTGGIQASSAGLAQGQVFGSNLVLDCKKGRGCSANPWSLLVENSSCSEMVGAEGFEPPTNSV